MPRKLFDIVDYTTDPVNLIDPVSSYLTKHSKDLGPGRCCCVFDIDDTLFSTRDDDEFIAVQKVGKYVYDICNRLNIDVVLVTARQGSPSSKAYVKKQLRQLNFEYTDLFMQSSKDKDTSCYKANCRRSISKKRKILLNVGDQLSDHFEGLSDQDEALVRTTFSPDTYYIVKIPNDPATLSFKFVENGE